ncbi:MAG: DUF1566 domain-containing protein [Spirochaetia bacterium]|nr:DUF1566 domain-containing protein [Spirochaetia bacterium]
MIGARWFAMFVTLAMVSLAAQTPTPDVETPVETPREAAPEPTGPKILPAFGEFEGRMGWRAAVAHCARKKMRLPSSYDLIMAYEADMMKTWKPQGWYWTSTDDEDPSIAFTILTNFGKSNIDPKGYANYVRCVKLAPP